MLIDPAGINFLRLIALKHQFYFAIVLICESEPVLFIIF